VRLRRGNLSQRESRRQQIEDLEEQRDGGRKETGNPKPGSLRPTWRAPGRRPRSSATTAIVEESP
jgi:hypothetical protein